MTDKIDISDTKLEVIRYALELTPAEFRHADSNADIKELFKENVNAVALSFNGLDKALSV